MTCRSSSFSPAPSTLLAEAAAKATPPSSTIQGQQCSSYNQSPSCVVHDTTAIQQFEKDRFIFKPFPKHLYLSSEDFNKNTTSSQDGGISSVPRLSLKPRTTVCESRGYDHSSLNLKPRTESSCTSYQQNLQEAKQVPIKRSIAFSQDCEDSAPSSSPSTTATCCYNFEQFHSTLLAINDHDDDDDWPTDETFTSDDVTSLFAEDSILLSPIDGLNSPPRSTPSSSSCYYESLFCEDSISIAKRRLQSVRKQKSSPTTLVRQSTHSPTNVFIPINDADVYCDVGDKDDRYILATPPSQPQPIVVLPRGTI